MQFSQIHLEVPEDVAEHFTNAWNNRDALKLANVFEEDAEFVNVVGLWWHNREDIWKAHEYGLRVIFNESRLEIRKISVKKLGDKVAIVHARMKLSGQTSIMGSEKPLARMNILSFVMHRKTNGWVCASAHNTDIVPGKETNIIREDGSMDSVDYRQK